MWTAPEGSCLHYPESELTSKGTEVPIWSSNVRGRGRRPLYELRSSSEDGWMTARPDSSIAALKGVAGRVLPLIDLTSLGNDDTVDDVDEICQNAVTPFGSVAAVCVWPWFVERATKLLSSAGVPVAGVANFPDGADDPRRSVADALEVVQGGGAEVDVVYPWKRLIEDGRTSGSSLVQQVRDALPADTVLKVILETGELADPGLIRTAALHAIDEGADFLKTSTGKTAHSATPEAVRLLCEIVAKADRPIGIKVSGGVRSVEDVAPYLDIADAELGAEWVGPNSFRIGASSLLDDVLTLLDD